MLLPMKSVVLSTGATTGTATAVTAADIPRLGLTAIQIATAIVFAFATAIAATEDCTK
jgi:hypothetical protein